MAAEGPASLTHVKSQKALSFFGFGAKQPGWTSFLEKGSPKINKVGHTI